VSAALLFLGSAALTLSWCASMSSMPGMTMPGGWTMSMAWMRMPGQSWPGAAATFLGMWAVMMIAMMLPVLSPMLWRYRQSLPLQAGNARRDRLVLIAAAGYFGVWILTGVAAWPLGIALAAAEMQWPLLSKAVPVAGGLVIVLAGALQLTGWKARQLDCCRGSFPRPQVVPDARDAWHLGIRLGLDCCRCCAPLTAVLFVAGVMDLRIMALVTMAIAAERLLPGGPLIARTIGLALLASGSIYSGLLSP
jgi:predicted metal-binding membrane protein